MGLETVADIEFRCVLAVVDMELHGIQVDKGKLDGLWKQLHMQRDLAEKKLKSKLGSDLNCNSQPQVHNCQFSLSKHYKILVSRIYTPRN